MSGKSCLACEREEVHHCRQCRSFHTNGSDHNEYCILSYDCHNITRPNNENNGAIVPRPSPVRSYTPIINTISFDTLTIDPIPLCTPIINPTYSAMNLLSPIRIINMPLTRGPLHRIIYSSSEYAYSNDIMSNINLSGYLRVSNNSDNYGIIVRDINRHIGPIITVNGNPYTVFAHSFGNGSPIYLFRS